jgi:hypothetical protein
MHQLACHWDCLGRRLKPGLCVDHSQGSDRIPRHVPDHFLPSTNLNILFNYKGCSAFFQQDRKTFESTFLHATINVWIWEQSNLGILGLDVLYNSWRNLRGTNPRLFILAGISHVTDDGVVGIPRNSESSNSETALGRDLHFPLHSG